MSENIKSSGFDSWNPEQYEKFKNERSQPFFDLMDLIEPCNSPRIIDLGCGTGELTRHLHQRFSGAITEGIDSSEEMLTKAKIFSGPQLSFQHQDIQIWNVKSKYDIVFSNAALQWCTDHANLFGRIRQSLRPQGQIAIQMPMNHDYPTHILARQMSLEKPWANLLDNKPYAQQDIMLSAEQYAKLIYDFGFQKQKVFLRVYPHVSESREGVIEWVKGTLLTYFKTRLSEKDYERFFNEFKERLFLNLPEEKPFFYPFKRLLLWGKCDLL